MGNENSPEVLCGIALIQEFDGAGGGSVPPMRFRFAALRLSQETASWRSSPATRGMVSIRLLGRLEVELRPIADVMDVRMPIRVF